jgi:hypothetical protein
VSGTLTAKVVEQFDKLTVVECVCAGKRAVRVEIFDDVGFGIHFFFFLFSVLVDTKFARQWDA